jgi:isoleucyl-tRNA synthetase
VALRGRAPYSRVVTAGWTLDEQGRAMSKSLGNGVDPVDIANRLGGEIVRLWVASIDFREDMAASENLMQRCADIYRKLRNTFRFLLGNLHGFDPVRDRVAESDLLPLDRYMLARTRELTEKVRDWYAAFEFHRVYHAVNEFAIVDLSSFYLDVLKDRMYTFAPTSQARRSAQTVLWQITEALVRLVAPILSFTADEVWEYLPEGGRPRGQRASGAVPQTGGDLLASSRPVAGRVEGSIHHSRSKWRCDILSTSGKRRSSESPSKRRSMFSQEVTYSRFSSDMNLA